MRMEDLLGLYRATLPHIYTLYVYLFFSFVYLPSHDIKALSLLFALLFPLSPNIPSLYRPCCPFFFLLNHPYSSYRDSPVARRLSSLPLYDPHARALHLYLSSLSFLFFSSLSCSLSCSFLTIHNIHLYCYFPFLFFLSPNLCRTPRHSFLSFFPFINLPTTYRNKPQTLFLASSGSLSFFSFSLILFLHFTYLC